MQLSMATAAIYTDRTTVQLIQKTVAIANKRVQDCCWRCIRELPPQPSLSSTPEWFGEGCASNATNTVCEGIQAPCITSENDY